MIKTHSYLTADIRILFKLTRQVFNGGIRHEELCATVKLKTWKMFRFFQRWV